MLTLKITEAEQLQIVTALSIYAAEYQSAADGVVSQLLKEGFQSDVDRITELRYRIHTLQDRTALHKQVQDLLAGDQFINAIRHVRRQTNVRLWAAKQYVEAVREGREPAEL